MQRMSRTVAALATSIVAAGFLSACGDPTTVNQTWMTTSELITSVDLRHPNQPSARGQAQVLEGFLDGKSGALLYPSLFRDECTPVNSSSTTSAGRWHCLALVEASGKVYLASGESTAGLSGTLESLSSSDAALTVTIVRKVKPIFVAGAACQTVSECPTLPPTPFGDFAGYLLVTVSMRTG